MGTMGAKGLMFGDGMALLLRVCRLIIRCATFASALKQPGFEHIVHDGPGAGLAHAEQLAHVGRGYPFPLMRKAKDCDLPLVFPLDTAIGYRNHAMHLPSPAHTSTRPSPEAVRALPHRARDAR